MATVLKHLLHAHGDAGGVIEGARGYEVVARLVLAGRRRRIYDRLARLSGSSPGDHVLDVGCGTGFLTAQVGRYVAPGGRVVGIDPAPSMIDYARRHVRVEDCEFRQGVGQDLPIADASVDGVVSALAFHHIPEEARDAALAEIHRVLRPGGRLLIADFRPPRSRLGRRLVAAHLGPDMATPQADRLPERLEAAGLRVIARGRVRSWLAYVAAVRPKGAAADPEGRA